MDSLKYQWLTIELFGLSSSFEEGRECYLCFEKDCFGEPFELYRYEGSGTLRCLILEYCKKI